MDLVILATKVWRSRLFTVPVIALTLLGSIYAVFLKPPRYEASGSYLLISPPGPPDAEQIKLDPELAHVRTDNPYTRFSDQSVVIEVLSRTLSSPSTRDALERKGADPGYTVAAAIRFGVSTPIVQVVGTGATPAAATTTARIVSKAVTAELDRMQALQHVDSRYRITTLELEAPTHPLLQPTGQMRMLIGILLGGTIVLFIIVSVADAVQAIAAERRAVRAGDPWTSDDLALLTGEGDRNADAEVGGDVEQHGDTPAASPRRRRSRM